LVDLPGIIKKETPMILPEVSTKAFAIFALFLAATALGASAPGQAASRGTGPAAPPPELQIPSAGACILHPRRELGHFDNVSIFYISPRSESDALSAPILVKSVEPRFPTDPRERQFSGTVEVALLLDSSGKPQDVYIEKSYSYHFDKNALEAVKRYRFHPALQNGRPVELKMCVEVAFHSH
jgi:TonB family protein